MEYIHILYEIQYPATHTILIFCSPRRCLRVCRMCFFVWTVAIKMTLSSALLFIVLYVLLYCGVEVNGCGERSGTVV